MKASTKKPFWHIGGRLHGKKLHASTALDSTIKETHIWRELICSRRLFSILPLSSSSSSSSIVPRVGKSPKFDKEKSNKMDGGGFPKPQEEASNTPSGRETKYTTLKRKG